MSSGERIRAARCGWAPAVDELEQGVQVNTLTSKALGQAQREPGVEQPAGAPADHVDAGSNARMNGARGSRRLGGHALFAASTPRVLTGEGTPRKNAGMQ